MPYPKKSVTRDRVPVRPVEVADLTVTNLSGGVLLAAHLPPLPC